MALKWLTDSKIAFNSVMAVDIWKGMGYIMTILIAGIMSISPVYYEAARIDGGNAWQCLNVIYGLKVFDIIYALTNGGPGHATEVLYTSVFKEFSLGRYAVGTTLSSVMAVFMVSVGYFMIRHMVREDGDRL